MTKLSSVWRCERKRKSERLGEGRRLFLARCGGCIRCVGAKSKNKLSASNEAQANRSMRTISSEWTRPSSDGVLSQENEKFDIKWPFPVSFFQLQSSSTRVLWRVLCRVRVPVYFLLPFYSTASDRRSHLTKVACFPAPLTPFIVDLLCSAL